MFSISHEVLDFSYLAVTIIDYPLNICECPASSHLQAFRIWKESKSGSRLESGCLLSDLLAAAYENKRGLQPLSRRLNAQPQRILESRHRTRWSRREIAAMSSCRVDLPRSPFDHCLTSKSTVARFSSTTVPPQTRHQCCSTLCQPDGHSQWWTAMAASRHVIWTAGTLSRHIGVRYDGLYGQSIQAAGGASCYTSAYLTIQS